ncbi:sigma 54-interacting transcriptional regulator [Bacillus sp. JJ1532]|uniref:sigma-54 interaction domain-containing protein n=1 Tax=Bacillus sp. JJ1532 TaxID=3122958 RepID=UPI002FFE8950
MVAETNIQELKMAIKNFFNLFPVNCELVLPNSESIAIPAQCQIVPKIKKTGINVLVKSKDENSMCVSCSFKDNCHITAANFTPVLFAQRVIGFILITPIKGQEDWLIDNINRMKGQLDVCSEWISLKLENAEIKEENISFKEEMNGVFSFLNETIILVGQDGVIHNISNSLCSKFKKEKTELIGLNINEIINDSDWAKISKTRSQQDLKITLKANYSNEKQENYLVKIKPLMTSGRITPYLLKLFPVLKQKEKLNEQRVLYSFHDVKGTSTPILSVVDIAKRVAPSDTTVLLRGESGTGKEVFAQSIHRGSNRKDGPFIALNCAAIPETLLESELFGHVKGAFTGSNTDKPGRFELANQGTIFLDEIGDLSLPLQAKLLRVVQERKIERIGDTKSTPVNVRIITATHRNLEELVSNGQFREDLYYRLNVIPITIPPLRERKEDIPILIEYYLKSFSKQLSRSPKRLSKEVYEILLDYHWTGNIRELQNVVHHFVQLEIGELITTNSLPKYIGELYAHSNDKNQGPLSIGTSPIKKKHSEEKELIIHLLDQFGRDTAGKAKVANHMDISLPTLYRRINKYKIT